MKQSNTPSFVAHDFEPANEVKKTYLPGKFNPSDFEEEKPSSASATKLDQFKQSEGINRTPLDTLQDLGAGALRGGQNIASGLGEIGQWAGNRMIQNPLMQMLSKKLQGTFGSLPKVNIREEMGLEGDNPIDLSDKLASKNPNSLAVGLGQYAPGLLGGGASLASQVGSNALYGASQAEPGHRIRNALAEGAGVYGMGKAIPAAKYAYNAGKKLVSKFSPQKEADSILTKLGQGAKTSDESAESLASDIRNAHDQREAEAAIHFNYVKDQIGHKRIYDKPDPLITTRLDEAKDILKKVKGLNVGEVANRFKNNQNFNNAHDLQSELGSWIGDFEKKPHKTTEELADLQKVKSVRNQLKKGMGDFLLRNDKSSNLPLSQSYKKGSDLFEEHVAPFLSDPKIKSLVRGGDSTVKNIHLPFSTPKNKINRRTGEVKIGPINKIMQDLPDESRHKILFNAIGGTQKNPLSLLTKLNNVRNKGFGKYFDKDLDESLNVLSRKINNKKTLTKTGKYAGLVGTAGLMGGAANHLLDKL